MILINYECHPCADRIQKHLKRSGRVAKNALVFFNRLQSPEGL
jgi:hypothetical protein